MRKVVWADCRHRNVQELPSRRSVCDGHFRRLVKEREAGEEREQRAREVGGAGSSRSEDILQGQFPGAV